MKKILLDILSDASWRGTLTQIFPNSKIANFSIKDRRKAYDEFLTDLIEKMKIETPLKTCWCCNKREGIYRVSRAEFPLTGAKKVLNYFPNWDNGISICPNCLFATQFSPLSMAKCLDEMALLLSDSKIVMESWTKDCIKLINAQIITNKYDGIRNFDYKNPINFTFFIVTKLITEFNENWSKIKPFIRLYFFSNYLQSPKIRYFDFPRPIFKFLVDVKNMGYYMDWMKYVHSKTFRTTIDKKKGIKDDDLIKTRQNPIFVNFMKNQSILRFFFNVKQKKKLVRSEIVELYLKEVINMDEKRIEFIKKLGDFIVEIMKKNGSKNILNKIESSSRLWHFREVLLKIEKISVTQLDNSIMDLDKVIKYLIPDGINEYKWRETRDFLLFRIYDQGYEFLKQYTSDIQDEIEDDLIETEDIDDIEMEEKV